jgi:hypothetical protein
MYTAARIYETMKMKNAIPSIDRIKGRERSITPRLFSNGFSRFFGKGRPGLAGGR